jgi:hypothetical protein
VRVKLRVWWAALWVAGVIVTSTARITLAQTPAPPPASTSKPDDTPSIRIGATLFADYTYVKSPETVDSDGNAINSSAFNVGRSYINITGNISHLVAFRLTPDISRETGAGSSLNGSLVFRVKYAYAQFNLDEWMSPGSYARAGVQQTPWVDFEEAIYRYRFQGTVFTEREGFLSSSDAGASFHYNLPSNYGDVHVGVYNGENYNRLEVNDQKALQVRGTVRPFAASTMTALRGLRVHGFFDGDHYVKDGPRRRGLASVTFEHPRLNAGFDFLSTADRTSVTRAEVGAHGFSVWATPRSSTGWEALLRYDHLTPDTNRSNETRSRTIVGAAYWFPHQGTVSSALLLDYDGQTFQNVVPAQPKQQRVAVHALVSF